MEDVIQPMSVWISYDCQSKREYLGVRFVTPRGEVDSAEILMDLSILPTQPYEWKHRSDQINEYYGLIQKEDHMVDALIEAMSKIPLTINKF